MKYQDFIDDEGRRILKYGRVTAVYDSIHATDCKAFVEPSDQPILLTVAEFVFLVGMAIIAQTDTHHEPRQSDLWIGDAIGEVLKSEKPREVGLLAEKTDQIWMNHRLKIELGRARRR